MKSFFDDKGNIWRLVGILVGLASVITGIVFVTTFSHSYYYSSITFGADFYTEIHRVTAAAANRVSDVYSMLGDVLGAFFILAGFVVICAFGSRLTFPEKKAAPSPAPFRPEPPQFGGFNPNAGPNTGYNQPASNMNYNHESRPNPGYTPEPPPAPRFNEEDGTRL